MGPGPNDWQERLLVEVDVGVGRIVTKIRAENNKDLIKSLSKKYLISRHMYSFYPIVSNWIKMN